GMLLTIWSGDGSALDVARVQPMKLAAMEGLYDGQCGQEIVAFGILNPEKTVDNDADPYMMKIAIPKGLSFLATHDFNAFVPGINDLIEGIEITPEGDTIHTDSYAQRIEIGRAAHDALRRFDVAAATGDTAAMALASSDLKDNYRYFGYGYLDSPSEAVPPVALTFYSFHTMVLLGGYLMLFFIIVLWAVYRRPQWLKKRWLQVVGMLTIPIVYVCSQAGWVTAEVGRQPWIIQDIMPVKAAISDIPASTVVLTFWLFALMFTAFLAAEVAIMLRSISKGSKANYESDK
ncbi:MAG: cytochrome ubiquinol oxidase subunit I, partial [Lachnospiraceae bacterium]|nr:cytochrome ubiquinol oxidase subunit I [Lachnospiraceae bacterium]